VKKLYFLLAIAFGVLASVNVQAQATVYTMTHSGDTVTNTGTKTVDLEVKNFYQTVSLQLKITKISGTVAGTVTLQGSEDGSNYVTIDSGVTATSAETFTATNVATQTTIFIVNGSPYRHYRMSYTGSGTMAARIYGYVHVVK
jgi:hypothetical protein